MQRCAARAAAQRPASRRAGRQPTTAAAPAQPTPRPHPPPPARASPPPAQAPGPWSQPEPEASPSSAPPSPALSPPRPRSDLLRAPSGAAGFDAEANLRADIERLSAARRAQPPLEARPAWLDATEQALVALFFVILAFGAWLIAGVVQQSATGGRDSSVSDAWLKLWPVVIQPCLGVFMAAAMVSAVPRWLRTSKEEREAAERDV